MSKKKTIRLKISEAFNKCVVDKLFLRLLLDRIVEIRDSYHICIGDKVVR